jgi:hypothetical protein
MDGVQIEVQNRRTLRLEVSMKIKMAAKTLGFAIATTFVLALAPGAQAADSSCSVERAAGRFAALAVTGWGQGNRFSLASPPSGGVLPKNKVGSQASQTSATNSGYNGIDYHGGPVMNDPHGVNVYFIWYGNWNNDTTPAILTDFVKHLDGTAYFNINSSYYDYNPGGEKDPVVNRINYGGSSARAGGLTGRRSASFVVPPSEM